FPPMDARSIDPLLQQLLQNLLPLRRQLRQALGESGPVRRRHGSPPSSKLLQKRRSGAFTKRQDSVSPAARTHLLVDLRPRRREEILYEMSIVAIVEGLHARGGNLVA